MRSYKGQVAIVGVGETPVGKVPGRSALWFNAEATRLALEDAGIDKSQVDGLVTAPSFVAPFARMSVAVSEYLGIRPTFSNTLNVSGATAAASVSVAAAAIHAGLADTVVVCCGDNMLSGLTRDLAVKALVETIEAGEGAGACPVLIVASAATDKSRTAKLLEKRGDALVAMFYPPDLKNGWPL